MSATPPKTPPTVRERTTNFLLYGFGLSILLHLLIGPLVHFNRTEEAPEKVETVKIDKMPTPPPTPKPTPKPTPTPPPTPPPKVTPPPKQKPPPPQAIKINTLKTKASTNGTEAANTHTTGSTNGQPVGVASGSPSSAPVATAPPTPEPTPVPTPTPLACAVPNADARTLNAAQPETPPLAQQQGITGEVVVTVTLDADSHLTNAAIARSPSPLLNNAALQAARQSSFKTRIVACKPVADTYNFIVDFQSQ
jgi:TonB family protein